MFEPVWRQLLGRQHRRIKAALEDYQRCCIRGESYPGIRPLAGSTVEGQLVFDLRPAELERLDRFEGSEYQRIEVEVITRRGDPCRCSVYLVRPEHRHRLLDKPWDPREFEASQLKHFLVQYPQW